MEEMNISLTFPFLFNETLKKFGKCDAFAFVGEKPISYEEVDIEIQAVISFLEKNGIIPGDKVAILSTNMPNWGIVFFAITFMGAVVVPILPDFSVTEVNNVICHSEAKAIFISSSLLSRLEEVHSEELKLRILIDDFSVISGNDPSARFIPAARPLKKYEISEDDLALLFIPLEQQAGQKELCLLIKTFRLQH